jgi:molybdopterin-guanine dinucleotide biosynthesis protein A
MAPRPASAAAVPSGARTAASSFDAVILAGGRGARLGGADKPALTLGASTLAGAVITAAIDAGAHRVIMVGPPRPDLLPLSARLPGGLAEVREDPPASGPVPALRCGVSQVRQPWAMVLAADLPFLRGEHLSVLLTAAALAPARDKGAVARAGAVLVDDEGVPQWLLGCWRAERLRSALVSYGGESLRGLFLPLHPVRAGWDLSGGQPPPWLDCDTPADLSRARNWHAQRAGPG